MSESKMVLVSCEITIKLQCSKYVQASHDAEAKQVAEDYTSRALEDIKETADSFGFDGADIKVTNVQGMDLGKDE